MIRTCASDAEVSYLQCECRVNGQAVGCTSADLSKSTCLGVLSETKEQHPEAAQRQSQAAQAAQREAPTRVGDSVAPVERLRISSSLTIPATAAMRSIVEGSAVRALPPGFQAATVFLVVNLLSVLYVLVSISLAVGYDSSHRHPPEQTRRAFETDFKAGMAASLSLSRCCEARTLAALGHL